MGIDKTKRLKIMETLELKMEHMKCYLDTELKGFVDNEKVILVGLDTIAEYWIVWKKLAASNQGCSVPEGFRPICHPLSDFTKEIEHNGKEFVPMIELAKISFPKSNKFIIINNYVDLGNNYSFHIDIKEMSFDCRRDYKGKKWDYNCYVPNQLQLCTKFFEWHFWIFDQSYFDKGIILDINKLKL